MESSSGITWREFCDRLSALGDRIEGDDFPHADEFDRADGIRHLAQQVVLWLGWAVGYDDAVLPAFMRDNDLVTPYGSSNVDNVYRRAKIDPKGEYRISGRMNSCERFLFETRIGDQFMGEGTTGNSISSNELEISPDGDFVISLSPTPSERNWIQTDPRTDLVYVREFYTKWTPESPAIFAIERLDLPVEPSPRWSVQRANDMLETAIEFTERSLIFWNEYDNRKYLEPNSFLVNTGHPSMGIMGGGIRWLLEPEEALVVEFAQPPGTDYWGFQLCNAGWMNQLDCNNRITNVNKHQAVENSDGHVRIVLAHRDPGVPNWVDTEGRRTGKAHLRAVWGPEPISPTATVVPFGEIRNHLPPDTLEVTSAARAETLRQRREHLAWRFRT